MEVILHIPDPAHATKLMAESQYYILKNRIEKYVKENNLSKDQEKYILEKLIEKIDKE
jgi:2-oxoglutarate dehydrogenase complex dehydrogenase (E1) component-like enzyme